METKDEASILKDIQEKYVPFLKKLISFLEKNKKASVDSVNKLRSIQTVFTTASPVEQIEVFVANQKKLEKWFKSAQKDKESGKEAVKSLKRPLVAEESDSSQGALEGTAKKSKMPDAFVVTVAAITPSSLLKGTGNNSLNKDPSAEPLVTNQDHQDPSKNMPNKSPPSAVSDVPVSYECASCRYVGSEELEFMKHIRNEHKSDLSIWCKMCGKCFSNAGVLVSHIKSGPCTEEEMCFRCGQRSCKFETDSGQTFVHHLRHCHKGSPFIFCIHCHKIFTLPHCLILHMQDECVHKERNRKDGSTNKPSLAKDDPKIVSPQPVPPPNKVQLPTISSVTSAVKDEIVSPQPVPPPTKVQLPTISSVASGVKDVEFKRTPSTVSKTPASRGRGRGRGKGRGRPRRVYESSDSDVDDPVWDQLMPSETSEPVRVRRSGRWAKRISEVVNAEPKRKTSLSLSEIKDKKDMLKCPCCDFMAAFKSVLQDHFIAQHKALKKNTCLVCNLKFESTALFVDHFDDHASGKLASVSKDSNLSFCGGAEKSSRPDNSILVSSQNDTVSNQFDVSLSSETLDSVMQKISKDNILNPTLLKAVNIPYQTGKGKKIYTPKFEEFKSMKVLDIMRCKIKLCHFFKCVWYDCEYTTNNGAAFSKHFTSEHFSRKKFYCSYCMKDCGDADALIYHMVSEHGNRRFQCKSCFYRAISEMHVQIHIQNNHCTDTSDIYTCDAPEAESDIVVKCFSNELSKTVWPYVCSVFECNFQTFHPNELTAHIVKHHPDTLIFWCYFCKVDFLEVNKLLTHYRSHGFNDFQCSYCVQGFKTRDGILEHLVTRHLDQPLRAFKRGNDDTPGPTAPAYSESSSCSESSSVTQHSTRADCSLLENIDFEKLLYDVVGETYYPKYLNKITSDFTCGVPWCRETFENIPSYCEHLEIVHGSLNFSCPHCPSVSETWVEFKDHLLCHGPELYACGFVTCDFYHWNKSTVEEHLKDHKQTSINSIIIRQISPDSKDHLAALADINSLSDVGLVSGQDTYQCFFCKYKCKNKQILKNHLYREMGYKRFSCNICGKKLVCQKDVFDHCKNLHSKTVECSIKANPVIEVFVKKIINQKIKSPDPEKMPCSVCSKKFRVFTQWQRHITLCIQKQYQPFDCDYCGARISDLKILKFHVDTNHAAKSVSYKEVSSEVVENEIGEKLMEVRLEYLNSIPCTVKCEENSQESSFLKLYGCSACSYESNHKNNMQAHVESAHSDVNASVQKILRKHIEQIPPEMNASSNDSTNLVPKGSKCYQCGFCIKKFDSIDEIRKHVDIQHSVSDKTEYSCNYYPNSNSSFEMDDKKLYECGYCKSGKQNLYSLKKHSDLMHSSIPFKVKCSVVTLKEISSSILSCSYCFKRVDGLFRLKQHTTAKHPSLSVKALGGYSEEASKKRSCEETACSSLKKIKFASEVFVCTHCGAAFSKKEEVAAHSRKTHKRLELSFYRVSEEDSALDYFKCEFCRFVSEAKFMNSHLNTKHKMRVTCGYCNKRFEFATKLREHHDMCHRGLPVKYVQETIGDNDICKQIFLSSDSFSIPKIDLSKIYVHLPKEGRKITALEFSKTCNIFPRVLLNNVC